MKILGTGSYLPRKTVTNDDIAESLDTTDEWIFSHTGIKSRHIAGEGESSSTMAAEAARRALAAAGVKPEEIGLVLIATSTPDYNTFPSTACLVQNALGCVNAGAMDVQAACAGFVYALETARGYTACHPEGKALVIGVETLSRIIDWTDRSSCIIFGDGAGAVVVVGDGADAPRVNSGTRVILGADGGGCDFIARSGGVLAPLKPGDVPRITFKGHEVFAFAVRTLAKTVADLCDGAGTAPPELDRVFAHQANLRILEATARRIKTPMEKFYVNLETTGNTSAASIPIAIDEAVRGGELKDGMKIVLVGFGAGLTYGGIYCVWPNL
ncbi:MAG: ketoacyl-ACP synthase III [Kiritimatiellae bacterium]|nr:ketoacyl-ACP synthase III [Kiritimatiellia bacterium]